MPKKVLIAESNTFLLEALSEAFHLFGFKIVGTTSERSNLDALVLKTKPDLLVVDLRLSRSGSTGFNDLKDLKEQLPEMKVIALGIHETTDQFIDIILSAGFDGFWNKYDKRTKLAKILTFLFP
ncbi:MAG: response regulator [Deltaproteobacteria bacterium]|jgi:DNA-binding NarL/FixJ family response regulator